MRVYRKQPILGSTLQSHMRRLHGTRLKEFLNKTCFRRAAQQQLGLVYNSVPQESSSTNVRSNHDNRFPQQTIPPVRHVFKIKQATRWVLRSCHCVAESNLYISSSREDHGAATRSLVCPDLFLGPSCQRLKRRFVPSCPRLRLRPAVSAILRPYRSRSTPCRTPNSPNCWSSKAVCLLT
ncbi:unnamed protein product [Ectocarpus sp. 12 AP-2014]